ncbi:hypothetical protein WICPIJ_000718 [Wickerhamomyces pijperi]|uniref:Mediator of RNA polymerase II transcription subunit 20 n=1 Tax=Wickerhamomyces pijperi TaxID=599730 RepID=A0A9P8QCY6_WICPI|nr:hypothetical protein WICPIJ_000718 [Wickerhamomyces pijperi]
MPKTAVITVANASTTSLSTFHDQMVLEVPKILERWAFDLKVFRSNNSQSVSNQTSFLFNINFEHENSSNVTIIENTAIISKSSPSSALLESGAASGTGDSLDSIILSKFQSLWLVRQTLKVENGYSYELMDGEIVVRAVNVFLNGSFKNFLIIVEDRGVKASNEERFNQLIQRFNLPKGSIYMKGFNTEGEYLKDLAYQIVQSLQF